MALLANENVNHQKRILSHVHLYSFEQQRSNSSRAVDKRNALKRLIGLGLNFFSCARTFMSENNLCLCGFLLCAIAFHQHQFTTCLVRLHNDSSRRTELAAEEFKDRQRWTFKNEFQETFLHEKRIREPQNKIKRNSSAPPTPPASVKTTKSSRRFSVCRYSSCEERLINCSNAHSYAEKCFVWYSQTLAEDLFNYFGFLSLPRQSKVSTASREINCAK